MAERVAAQIPELARDCLRDRIVAAEPNPKSFYTTTQSLRDSGRFLMLVDSVQTHFTAHGQALTPQTRIAMMDGIDRLRNAIQRIEAPPDFTPLGQPSSPDSNGSYVIFPGRGDSIVVSMAMPESQRQAVCWAAIEAADVASDFQLLDRQKFLKLLNNRTTLWENFHAYGYSMFLPEALINSWWGFPRHDLEPPRDQVIVLHPSVGVEVPLPIKKNINGSDAMLLEAIGVVHYTESRTHYWGGSLGTVFEKAARPGYSAFIHYGNAVNVGYVLRPHAHAGERRNTLILSVDLGKALSTSPAKWRSELDRLRGKANSCLADPLKCKPAAP